MPDTFSLAITKTVPDSAEAWDELRTLFRDYQADLGIDLCFQGFEAELAGLPGDYAAPAGWVVVAQVDGQPAGCCALRALNNTDHINACEMKRLFVQRGFRGLGLGRLLAEWVVTQAQVLGYSNMLLDTLSDMEAARALYQELGFVEVAPYYLNPLAGAHYLKLDLSV